MWDRMFERVLRDVFRSGTVHVTMPGGRIFSAGSGAPEHAVRIIDPTLPRRIVMNPDLGMGEGYMNGGLVIEGDDLRGLMNTIISNNWRGNRNWMQHVQNHARRLLRPVGQLNPMGRARRNVAHHYDLSSDLYDIFLDDDRQYSCAYFVRDDDSLERAQAQKKEHIARKLLIEPGMEVLDIGCGWGGLGLTLARDFDARVTGVTLSEEQHAIAVKRARDADLSDRVDFRLQDYRTIDRVFDRIVSVGMFEHVGLPHYGEYFGKVHDMLAPGGVALIHTIGRTTPPGSTSSWITKYIFPGGYVPALSEMTAAWERKDLAVTDVEVWRLHYAKTLNHWERRFTAGIDRARTLYDDRFCRMWRYYLIICELTFVHGQQVVFQAQLAHEKDAVPITRDYLYGPPEHAEAPTAPAYRREHAHLR